MSIIDGKEITESNPPEIIHQRADGWYFYDETWSYAYGPFTTQELAQKALDRYCIEELGYGET